MPNKIAKILASDPRYIIDSIAYDLYNVFSKFEHFGALAFDFQKDLVDFKNIEQNSLIRSISYVFYGLDNLILNLPDNTEFIDRFKKIEPIIKELIENK
ncbi:MAG: hypothetical protein JXJ22_04290 [Bacteroidales bacterium]|nr:hypothetical protein [Bacteroidales bacterium]